MVSQRPRDSKDAVEFRAAIKDAPINRASGCSTGVPS